MSTVTRAIQPISIGIGIAPPSIVELHMDKYFRLFLSVRAASLPVCYAACALFLVALGGWAPGARAGMVMIDDFSHPDPYQFFLVNENTDPSAVITHSSVNALGGQRDTLVSVTGSLTPNSATGVIGLYSEVNALSIGTNGLSPTVTKLQYSGTNLLNTPTSLVNAHNLGGGLGIDLTDGGTNDRFLIQFISSDAQPTLGA